VPLSESVAEIGERVARSFDRGADVLEPAFSGAILDFIAKTDTARGLDAALSGLDWKGAEGYEINVVAEAVKAAKPVAEWISARQPSDLRYFIAYSGAIEKVRARLVEARSEAREAARRRESLDD
jgi:hypothetical protein